MGDTTLDRLRAYVAAYEGLDDALWVAREKNYKTTVGDLRALLALAEAAVEWRATWRAWLMASAKAESSEYAAFSDARDRLYKVVGDTTGGPDGR